MQKPLITLALALAFTSTLMCAPLEVGPIFISGSGIYGWDGLPGSFQDAGYSLNFSGSDGTDTVEVGGSVLLCDEAPFCPHTLSAYLSGMFLERGGAFNISIDGLTACSTPGPDCANSYFTFDSVYGVGTMLIQDQSGVLAEATLVGSLRITGETDYYSNGQLAGVQQFFEIDPVVTIPEPSTAWVVIGLLVAVSGSRTRI
jgi:hypothetical protein